MSLDEGWKAWAETLVAKLTAFETALDKLKTDFYEFRREFEKTHLHAIEDQAKEISNLLHLVQGIAKLDVTEICTLVKQHDDYINEQQAIELEKERSDKELEKEKEKGEKKSDRFTNFWLAIATAVATSAMIGLGATIWNLITTSSKHIK